MGHFTTCLPVAAARLRMVRLTASFAQAGGQATQTGARAKCRPARREMPSAQLLFSAVQSRPSVLFQAPRGVQTFVHLLWGSFPRRPGKSERELFRLARKRKRAQERQNGPTPV